MVHLIAQHSVNVTCFEFFVIRYSDNKPRKTFKDKVFLPAVFKKKK